MKRVEFFLWIILPCLRNPFLKERVGGEFGREKEGEKEISGKNQGGVILKNTVILHFIFG